MSKVDAGNLGANRASSVMGQIQSTSDRIQGLLQQVMALMEQMKAHKASKPPPPGQGANQEVVEKYNQSAQQWVDSLQKMMRQITKLVKKIRDEEQKLAKLQGSDLPRAQSEDAAAMRKQLEESRKSLETQAAAFDTDDADQSEDVASGAVRIEIKALLKKGELEGLQIQVIPPSLGDPQVTTGRTVPQAGGSGIPIGD